jgi:hypothetical protein
MSDALYYSYSVENNGNRTMPPFSFLSYGHANYANPDVEDNDPEWPRTLVTITIQAYDGNTLITEKQIKDVDILKNRTVRYTGHLFENIAFSLSVDEEWKGICEETF